MVRLHDSEAKVNNMATMEKVNLKTLRTILPHFWKLKLPLYLWGRPSTGKTSTFRDFAIEKAKELGLEYSEKEWGPNLFTFQVTYLSQMDAPDLIGLPTRTKDKQGNEITQFIASDVIPRVGQGIWLLDEMNHADKTIRSAANQFVLDRRYHNIILPEKVWVVAASNSEQDFCEVNPTPLNILSRFHHLEVMLENEEFIRYLLEKGADTRVIGYLKNFPEDLFPKVWDEKLLDAKANPFPRQWEDTSKLISGLKDYLLIQNLAAACVGASVASKFIAFCKMTGKLDIPRLIAKPKEEIEKINENKDKASLFWAIISSLASFWYKREKKLTAQKVVEITNILPAEFGVALLQMILRKRRKELTVLREFDALLRRLGVYWDE